MTQRPIRIANFSGALGDYIGAFADAIRGEPIDVAIGDYLAEMTMGRVAEGYCATGHPERLGGYFVGTFLRQLKPELPLIAERGIKVVVNAGAFAPTALANLVRAEIVEQDLSLRVAHVLGDDVLPHVAGLAAEGQLHNLDTGRPLGDLADRIIGANAYLGGWGIAAALQAGADIVICGRVSDASLVLGPAAWWHGWAQDAWDQLAGAVAAGHIIECGPQAVGGNFSGFAELGSPARLGFPIAEIAADGRSIITKRQGDGGAVTVDTVTAQLLYEIQGPRYLNPDVVLHVDSVQVTQDGPDRVRIDQVKGSSAPETTKVGCFHQNGWRTLFWGFATGLDHQTKIDWLRLQLQSIVDSLSIDEFHFEPCGQPIADPKSEAEGTVAIRIAAAAQSRSDVAKLLAGFSSFGLGGIPGFHGDASGAPQPRVAYWPGLMRQSSLRHQAVLDDGTIIEVAMPPTRPLSASPQAKTTSTAAVRHGPTIEVPLGDLIHARSGDKGANANLGVWCRDPASWEWLRDTLDAPMLSRLMGLRQDVVVERHELANVNGLLFVLNGYFGESGTGNVGLDQIGKAAGEFLRARIVSVPGDLVSSDRSDVAA